MRSVLAAALLVTATLQAQAIRNNEGFRASSVARNDDGSSSLVPIGFNVNFFGRTRTHAYVNNNGNITFDAALATFTPFGLGWNAARDHRRIFCRRGHSRRLRHNS